MRSLARLFCLLTLAAALSPLRADDVTTAFDRANKLGEEGKYAEAAAAYEKMLAVGRASPALYFNLGNALFKSGHIGQAILNYRLAERMAPRDPDIRANLRFARGSVAGSVAAPLSLSQRWTGRLTLNEWSVLSGVAFWLWLGMLVAGQFWPERRATWRRPLLASFTALVLFGSGLLVGAGNRFLTATAIVVEREAVLHHGPLEESPKLQTLHDGQELQVLDRKDNWLQVGGAARGVGWLRRDAVVLLDGK